MGVMDICPFFCFSAFVYKCALRVQCFMAIVKKGFVTYDENFISLMHSTSKKKKKKKNKNLFFIFFSFLLWALEAVWNQPVETETFLCAYLRARRRSSFRPVCCFILLLALLLNSKLMSSAFLRCIISIVPDCRIK